MKRANWPPIHAVGAQPSGQNESAYASRVERERVQPRLPKHLVRKLKVFCVTHRVDMQTVIERGIEFFFATIESEGHTGLPDSQTPTVCVSIDNQDHLDTETHTHTGLP